MEILLILSYSSLLSNVFLSIYLIHKDSKALTNRLYGMAMFLVGIWSLMEIALIYTDSVSVAVILARILLTIALASSVCAFYFYIIFTKRKFRNNIFILSLIYTPIILMFVYSQYQLSDPTLIAEHVTRGYDVFFLEPIIGLLGVLSFYMIIQLIFSIQFYKGAKYESEKKSAKILIFGILFIMGGGAIVMASSLFLGKSVPFALTPLSTVNSFLVGYAIIKYGLFNVTNEMISKKVTATMTDFLVVVDSEKNVLMINDSVQKHLEYEKEDIIHRPFIELMSESEDILDRLNRKSILIDYEADIITRYNKLIAASVNGSVIKDGLDNVLAYVLIIRDVRHNKELLKSMQDRRIELEASKNLLQEKVKELEAYKKENK